LRTGEHLDLGFKDTEEALENDVFEELGVAAGVLGQG
jgi:hypothetical protein